MIGAINLDLTDAVRWALKNWSDVAFYVVCAALVWMAYDLLKTWIAARGKK